MGMNIVCLDLEGVPVRKVSFDSSKETGFRSQNVRFIERKLANVASSLGKCGRLAQSSWEKCGSAWAGCGSRSGLFGLAALARGCCLTRANGSFSSLVSRNCHSFATVSRSLVALAEVRGALRLRGRMLVRVRDSRKRMVA